MGKENKVYPLFINAFASSYFTNSKDQIKIAAPPFYPKKK